MKSSALKKIRFARLLLRSRRQKTLNDAEKLRNLNFHLKSVLKYSAKKTLRRPRKKEMSFTKRSSLTKLLRRTTRPLSSTPPSLSTTPM